MCVFEMFLDDFDWLKKKEEPLRAQNRFLKRISVRSCLTKRQENITANSKKNVNIVSLYLSNTVTTYCISLCFIILNSEKIWISKGIEEPFVELLNVFYAVITLAVTVHTYIIA